jgi:acyl-CoA synthetase (AMP-forming)/AMP-acid ligase II
MLDSPRFPSFTSLADLLHHRAAKQPDDRAYIFLSDQGNEEAVLTFADLARGAGEVAARLAQSQMGDRALLLFGPGLDFIVAYFGCLLAGVIAVRFERQHCCQLVPSLCDHECAGEPRSAGRGRAIRKTQNGMAHCRFGTEVDT